MILAVGALLAGCAASDVAEETDLETASLRRAPKVTPAAILAKLRTCRRPSDGKFATDAGGQSTVSVCHAKNAVYFTADLDVDCDGRPSIFCNRLTDPSYQTQTAANDSQGQSLDAATLPYIVVPGASSRWSYRSDGISMGSVGAVIYDGKIAYGIVGDVGPKAIIGEASFAMASSLGIDANPSTGGVSSGVTYVIFTGDSGTVHANEDHDEAVAVGTRRAEQLLVEN